MKAGKRHYQCQQCGAVAAKWAGQCAECEQWNTLEEGVAPAATAAPRLNAYTGEAPQIINLNAVNAIAEARLGTGLAELDRVLGGGLGVGSVGLLGGDPGIGE